MQLIDKQAATTCAASDPSALSASCMAAIVKYLSLSAEAAAEEHPAVHSKARQGKAGRDRE